MIAHALLSKWGIEGLQAHTAGVAAFYRAKRDVFQTAMDRHLKGLARWSIPQAGMFFWCVSVSSSLLIALRPLVHTILAH